MTPTIYLVHGGNAYAVAPECGRMACLPSSSSYLITAAMLADGRVDDDPDAWGEPAWGCLGEETEATLRLLHSILQTIPLEVPAP